ncbi:MAG: ATP-binding cassette domain-containing protein, partial [Acetobacteraceae bacterium]
QVVGAGTPTELGGVDGVTALLLNRSQASGASAGRRPASGRAAADPAISLRNLETTRARVERLDCHYGEIVGFAGVEGSGNTEVIEALAGLQECDAEAFRVGDTTAPFPSPQAAVRAGVVALPPDRKNEGIFADLTIAENVGLGTDLPQRAIFHPTRWAADKAVFAHMRVLLAIKAHGPMQTCQSLSGGNQQKVLFGRAMASGARIWLLSEPTRGIDVGAREELYALIRERAAQGWCVVIKSIDPAELASVCDRAYVFAEGRIVRELGHAEISEQAIYSAGLADAAAG